MFSPFYTKERKMIAPPRPNKAEKQNNWMRERRDNFLAAFDYNTAIQQHRGRPRKQLYTR